MRVSFCTTVKGRLWQLQKTLPTNIKLVEPGRVEIVILDYFSNDGLKQYLQDNFAKQLRNKTLLYYRLTDNLSFSMAYAKNIVHRLAPGTGLFNLDADNFIGTAFEEMQSLRFGELLVAKSDGGVDGRPGRIGVIKSDFLKLNGYNETIVGMKNDDGEFVKRAVGSGFKLKMSVDDSWPIQNSLEDKLMYVDVGRPVIPNYPAQFGVANIVDINGNPVTY